MMIEYIFRLFKTYITRMVEQINVNPNWRIIHVCTNCTREFHT